MGISTVSTGTGCLLAIALVTSVLSRPQKIQDKIIGGNPVSIEDYPYQLALEGGNRHICGASILTRDWALTAAHCVFNQPVAWLKFRAGSSRRETGGSLHSVGRYVFHRQYNRETIDYDIAVVSVKNPFNFTTGTLPITLPLNSPLHGDPVTVMGWGYLEHEQLHKPKQLMATRVFILDWRTCKESYYTNLTPRMICAGAPMGDICSGDSGGPLIKGSNQQVGISSWSYKCGEGPSVYTNVTAFFNWILNETGLDDVIIFPDP